MIVEAIELSAHELLTTRKESVALIWCKQVQDTRYEVRSAGATRRLYTNGVLHSQYNPRHAVAGGVWELLWLPALLHARKVSRALLLGVGGGAVIRQLRHHIQPESITAVEIDPIHLDVARRFFAVAAPDLELVAADARDWLRDGEGPRFDLIIDDLFGHAGGQAQRAVTATRDWMVLLSQRLAPGGVLVSNYSCAAEFNPHSVPHRFSGGVGLTTPGYGNFVVALCETGVQARDLRRRVRAYGLPGGRKFAFRARTLGLSAPGQS